MVRVASYRFLIRKELVEKSIEDFRARKGDVIRYVKVNGIDPLSSFCAMVGIPLLAAYTYVLEDMPEHKSFCENKINSLYEFYGYKRG